MTRFLEQLRRIWSGWRGRAAAAASAELGAAGERAAEAHLRANGLRILARNWRNPRDERQEIDLVCEEAPGPGDRGPMLVFVEVKARAAGARVSGYHAVDKRKKAALLRACRAYLSRLRPVPAYVRFDIVEVAHGVDAQGAAAAEAMRLDPAISSVRDGRWVWHYRNVALFTEQSTHRHARRE
jgi:putative endonuclease